MEPRRCHGLVIRAHELIAHGLVIRAHGLLIRAHGLLIRAHGLVSPCARINYANSFSTVYGLVICARGLA